MGSVVNLIVGICLTVFFTHLSWFGVAQKHGCCCFILCCCLGKPNLLVTAILTGLFGILGIISAVQAIGLAQGALIVVVLIVAFCALAHGVALLYVGFEAFMIWKLCPAESSSESGKTEASTKPAAEGTEVVGAAQVVGVAAADIEAAATKTE